MLQAFLVVPGFAAAYLWAGPPRLGRRIWQTALMGAGIVAGAGWWILAAELTPAADRPYFGGSTNNNILQLAIGYNGLGRLTGNETGSIGPGGGGGGGQGASFGGATGIFRLFQSEFGGQISWLLPAALISLAAMAWVSRRAARTDRTRAAALLWGGWVLVTGLVFSYMNGIIHPYYMVALAPGIAALAGIGAMALWQERLGAAGRARRAGAGHRRHRGVGLRAARPDAGLAAVAALGDRGRGRGRRGPGAGPPWLAAALARSRRGRLALAAVPLGLALVAGLAGPAAYALDTVGTAAHRRDPERGRPGGFGGGPGGGGPRRPGRFPRRPGRPAGAPAAGQAGTAGTGPRHGTGTGAPAGTGAPGGAPSPGPGRPGPRRLRRPPGTAVSADPAASAATPR